MLRGNLIIQFYYIEDFGNVAEAFLVFLRRSCEDCLKISLARDIVYFYCTQGAKHSIALKKAELRMVHARDIDVTMTI